jgi:hypothetical protein
MEQRRHRIAELFTDDTDDSHDTDHAAGTDPTAATPSSAPGTSQEGDGRDAA